MSEDEMEKFEITDYDLDNEFNMHRNRKRMSKHHQIYGIWADNSDEDEEKAQYKSKKVPKNYTAPIGFVAGGIQQAGKKGKENDKGVKKEEISDDEEPTTSFKTNMNSSDDSEDEAPRRAGFGSDKPKKSVQSTVTEISGDIAGLRKKNTLNTSLINKGVGNWEKHTKGIGAKLLLQMGFQPGKGLGKELQGISAPVEAHLRKGRGAIGAYGPEKLASIPKMKEQKLETEEDDTSTMKGESKWKKSEISNNKTRYYYRSVDDVIEKGKRPGAYKNLGVTSELSKVKVIDMTGPQQRVLSGYHALSGLKAPPGVEHYEDVVHKKCSNFALPEIQHNLDLLVDMCEQDIIKTDRNTRLNEDKIVTLEHEEKALKEVIKKESHTLDTLKQVMGIVNKLMDPVQEYSLGQIANIFADLQEQYNEEYCMYELGELAPGLIGPLLTSALASWNPLTSPKQYVDVFQQWKDILDRPKQRGNLEGNKMGIQPFDSLIWHTWMPVMRTCVSSWNPRDCDPLITVMETWKPVLPPWIVENILDQLIMPKLLNDVNNWNPLICKSIITTMLKLMVVISAILASVFSAPAPAPVPKPKPGPNPQLYYTPYVAAAPGIAYTSGYVAPVGYSGYPAYVEAPVYETVYEYAAPAAGVYLV